ncbi:MAG: hypothetical protein Q3983_09455, partial [Capnocytophaga sp.]|nr:hypothetical protein [Capnocytophaga sp.]
MKSKINNLFGILKETFKKYPLVLLCTLCCTFCFVFFIQIIDYQETNYKYDEIASDFIKTLKYEALKFSLVFALGISLFFGIQMLCERYGKSFIFHLLGFLF